MALIARRVGTATSMSIFLEIFSVALEAQAAAGHVFARDHIVGQAGRRTHALKFTRVRTCFFGGFSRPFPLPPRLHSRWRRSVPLPFAVAMVSAVQLAVVTHHWSRRPEAAGSSLAGPGEDVGFHQCRGGERSWFVR